MSKEQNIVIIAGYQSVEPATRDFDPLVQLVKDKKIKTDGMILVQKDKDGKVTINETGDHAGRKGAGWGGGVGVLVGLAAPPMLAAVAVGAAAGAVVGKFAKHKVESGIESGLGEKLKPGTAAILATVRERGSPGSRAGAGRLAGQVGRHHRRRASKARWPKRPASSIRTARVLPIPDRTFGGVAGRTLRDSVADWMMIPGPKAPEGAPNVLLVLIDDAGFGGPSSFGGPINTPSLHTRAGDGPDLQPAFT